MTPVATGLNFPMAMTFHGDTIWVTEEGTASAPPAVKAVRQQGQGHDHAHCDHASCGELGLAVIFPTTDVLNSFNKPIDVRFRGPEMFIVDFGFFVPGPVTANSGKILYDGRPAGHALHGGAARRGAPSAH
jgi:hypothetical protein